jgi:hypothetical protein
MGFSFLVQSKGFDLTDNVQFAVDELKLGRLFSKNVVPSPQEPLFIPQPVS